MRAWLLVLAACGFPDGRPQTWPPDGTIAAVAAGDLDADGLTDVVAFTDSIERSRGAYLVRGGAQLDLDAVAISGFDTFRPTPLANAAMLLDDTHVALVAGDALIVYSLPELREVVRAALGGDGSWLRRFGADRVAIGAGTRIWLAAIADLVAGVSELAELPPPPETWAGSQLAAATGDAIVVATATRVYRRTALVWDVVRDGLAWTGQIAIDLTGDGLDDIVGLEAQRTCALDPATAETGCRAAPNGTFTGAQLLAAQLAGDARPELVVVQLAPALSVVELLEDCSLRAGALDAARAREPEFHAGHTPFHLFVAPERSMVISIDQVGFAECFSCL